MASMAGRALLGADRRLARHHDDLVGGRELHYLAPG